MSLIFVDRRKTSKNKSSANRQKLVKRVKKYIKASSPQNIGKSDVSGNKVDSGSPVRIAASALTEPYFRYESYGEEPLLIIGNDKYDRNDIVHIGGEGEGDGKGKGGHGRGEGGEDDFVVNVAKDEFLDLFFEDCELPNLINKYTDTLENSFRQAGFSTSGNPAQLSILRSYKQALGRRLTIGNPITRKIEELEALLKTLPEDKVDDINAILAEIEMLRHKRAVFNNFDASDLRYHRREAVPMKTVDAVLIMVMDVSGSMSEEMKLTARRWFALLYAFMKRKYKTTELVFIAHTDEAIEMSEDDFFSTRINGGTLVSPALHMVNSIIKERYDPNQTNIYVCHASDGDNWEDDDKPIIQELGPPGNMLGKIQMFTYVEIGNPFTFTDYGGTLRVEDRQTPLGETYANADFGRDEYKVKYVKLNTPDDCYPVFKKLFQAKKQPTS